MLFFERVKMMEREHSAVCIGHKDCFGLIEEELENLLISLIERGVLYFYNVGMGHFDMLCARKIWELKERFPAIRQYLVIPYLSFRMEQKEYFDEIIYPEGFERYSFKSAISARNRYMVRQAAYAVCYVQHGWGGAAKTYEYAVRNGCRILHLGRYRYGNDK